jgi:hypothetical protein
MADLVTAGSAAPADAEALPRELVARCNSGSKGQRQAGVLGRLSGLRTAEAMYGTCKIVPTSCPQRSPAMIDSPGLGCKTPGRAEGVGFEPTRSVTTPSGFQDRRHRPLGEPSRPAVSARLTVIVDHVVPCLFRAAVVPVAGQPVTSQYRSIVYRTILGPVIMYRTIGDGCAERLIDRRVRRDLLPVNAVGVDLEQYRDAVAQPPGDLRCRDSGVEPQGRRRVAQVVGPLARTIRDEIAAF